ncbi:flagellar basal body-associated protein FliL [Ectopseudomonas hydrolytica]|uniref:flagellar basal body-associated protein FliL n=1 Tax=Ectopseudomonas hydrolytica TaxID=2493633 RepID=UPI0018A7A288|nr:MULTISPECIES: flagellar basal body-associated protein FliL [Pseudomonas]MBF8160196.1 flagellar basal body-associated protein FliL [Pseudomonas mendocina]UTH32036.1 flagellar basal body-associated protein FliL [Pseudomonas hydrolytica]UTH36812.1 flagellar basal body-associated protein FliL [Pseudomonas sp. KHPS1]UZZ11211.1 flagellar basal body-associated protein FliL [Pseudomonas mendocina]
MRVLSALLLSLSLCLPVLASSEKKEEVPQTLYYNLVPALIGNLADGGNRLKFFKADVALRVNGAEAEARIKHHDPLIRHQLVLLFSAQTSESINAPEGRENLRQEALKQVQQALTAEEGKPVVEDLLFNNLIIQ